MDKKYDKKLFSNLEKLGLSTKESLVYVYLMQRTQEVGTSKIIQGTSLHGQYVYTALTSLEEMGLVKHVVKNGRKKWSGNPPNRIDSLIEEKKNVANRVKDDLEKLFTRASNQEFEVYQGEEQFVANEFRMIREAKENGTILIIGGAGNKFSEILGEQRREYNQESLDRNIMVKFIGTSDQREYLTWVKDVRRNFEFRIMPGLNSSSVGIAIHDETILFHVYGNPLLVFKIKSDRIASDYKSFFESLWALCSN